MHYFGREGHVRLHSSKQSDNPITCPVIRQKFSSSNEGAA